MTLFTPADDPDTFTSTADHIITLEEDSVRIHPAFPSLLLRNRKREKIDSTCHSFKSAQMNSSFDKSTPTTELFLSAAMSLKLAGSFQFQRPKKEKTIDKIFLEIASQLHPLN
jgi:hypothetical protein